MIYLKEEDVDRLLTMPVALEAVEEVLRFHGEGKAVNIARSRVRLPNNVLHVMSGGVPDLNVTGLKSYTTTPHGAQFLILLYQADTGACLAIIEADKLGQTRTGATSGVATKYMAKSDAQTVGIIGTGWQARSQLAAVCGVRSITSICTAWPRGKSTISAWKISSARMPLLSWNGPSVWGVTSLPILSAFRSPGSTIIPAGSS